MSSMNVLSDADFLKFPGRDAIVVVDAREINCRDDRGQNADTERYRETLDRTCAELKQNHAGEKRGDIGIENRRQGVLITGFDGRARRPSGPQLLADALVDQNVG